MNKTRIDKLEAKAEDILLRDKIIPQVWRPEKGKIAIVATAFILDRLRDLGREIIYSPYIFHAVYVDREDKEIIDKIEGRLLYLRGLKQPINGTVELIFVKTKSNE